MKSKILLIISILSGSCLILGQRTAAGQQGKVPTQPQPERDVTVNTIPGIVTAGVQWTAIWHETGNNADGIVAAPDGDVLAAQIDLSRVVKIDTTGKASVFLSDTHGGGSLSYDRKGKLYSGEHAPPRAIVVLAPQRKTVADTFNDKPLADLGSPNDLVADSKGGAYFTLGEVYYAAPSGKITQLSQGLHTNGIVLSRNDKTLYVTNGAMIVAFDVQPNGMVANQRELGEIEGGGNGDGMTIDSEGRLYVSTNKGVQILSADGKYLGIIPTPRNIISVCFGGLHKKALYIVGNGSKDAEGQEVTGRSRTIYRLPMLAQGYKNRSK
jgi:gluconolactonase